MKGNRPFTPASHASGSKISHSSGRMVGRQTNFGMVARDIGMRQWHQKEMVRLELRRNRIACQDDDGLSLQIPFRPLTGGSTYGIPLPYLWVYAQPSRFEDRPLAVEQWNGRMRLETSDLPKISPVS
mmetsp:Transcript_18862/g.43361  ORF Transcript_18862/g.43361 Transcript_18862/m.43361 type:complete len:127 (-) Transcript_18862:486-866(-)